MTSRSTRALRFVSAVGAAAIAFGASLAATPAAFADEASTVKLNLVNINDFHGRISKDTKSFAAKVANLTSQPNSLFLSAGDNVGASLYASSSAQDQPTIDVLNALGLKASAVGNHEFDRGASDLDNRIIGPDNARNAKWDYLGANVYKKGTKTPAYKEYSIQNVGGVRVAVIGTVTQEVPTLVSPSGTSGLDFGDPVEATNRVADELTDGNDANGEADVVVAEFHEGAPEGTVEKATIDQELQNSNSAFAKIVHNTSSKVSAILTGHTHKQYAWVDTQHNRPVLQTGSYGENIGQVTLDFDKSTKKVTAFTQQNFPTKGATSSLPVVAEVDKIAQDAMAAAAVKGNEKIGSITADFTRAHTSTTGDSTAEDRGAESTLGNLVGNMLRDTLKSSDRGGAEIGVVNPGGLRADLTMGDDNGVVTMADANAVLPFANNLNTVSLTGAQFKELLEEQWRSDSNRPKLNLGLSDNVQYTFDASATQGNRIKSIMIGGSPIDPKRSYRIGTFSFLASGGDAFTVFTKGANLKDSGLIDFDGWVEYIKNHSPMTPSYQKLGVEVKGMPATVKPGDDITLTLGSLKLTSGGVPDPKKLDAFFVGGDNEQLQIQQTLEPGVSEQTIKIHVPETLQNA